MTQIDVRRQQGVVHTEQQLKGLFPDRTGMVNPNTELAAAAEQGDIRIASAAWWGWDAADSTENLQRAFSAPVDTLIIPAMEGPWFTGPLILNGPKNVFFEPGAEIIARRGGFQDQRESLITLFRQSGIRLTGYGARLAMRRYEYAGPEYEWSQWRHALSLLESQGIVVEGFLIEESGGDGIYIGQKKGGVIPRDIHLRDLYILNNYRQGVSVISADGFLMEYTYIAGTHGTPPMAAIDFEPNNGLYGLTDCTVFRCVFEKNTGAALTVHLPNLTAYHLPVSININDTCILGNPLSMWIHGFGNGAYGSIVFSNCRVSGIGFQGRGKNFTITR